MPPPARSLSPTPSQEDEREGVLRRRSIPDPAHNSGPSMPSISHDDDLRIQSALEEFTRLSSSAAGHSWPNFSAENHAGDSVVASAISTFTPCSSVSASNARQTRPNSRFEAPPAPGRSSSPVPYVLKFGRWWPSPAMFHQLPLMCPTRSTEQSGLRPPRKPLRRGRHVF